MKAGIKDWFHQNFNFNNWSNGVKSVGNWGSNSYKSVDHWASNIVKSVNIVDIGDWFSNNLKSIFGSKGKNNTPAIKYAPANAYSFGGNGSNSDFVSAQSMSPGMGYNNMVEMHPYANARDLGLKDLTNTFNNQITQTKVFFENKNSQLNVMTLFPGSKGFTKLLYFTQMVKTNAPFDLKNKGYQKENIGEYSVYKGYVMHFDDYGNFNYGVAA